MEQKTNFKIALSSNLKIAGSYVIRTWCSITGKLLWESPVIKNAVVLSSGYGLDILTRQLGGDTTYSIEIDSASIGTGSPTISDATTDLATPVLEDIIVADTSYPTAGQVLKSFFIPDADLPNGTYTEFGLKCNGRLFAISLITPNFSKGSNQNTTVDYTITATTN